ncbi:MAG: aminoacyl-histidine dipeptidase [Ruminococcaceae bacterium]|nr:aminoacyl-histidine dipeptidase [Oscillospiraceae bacterium]
MGKLSHLQPNRVFHYFEQLCGIPHGSGDTARISDYCVAFAKAHNLWVRQDTLGNVLIKKPATPGYEDHPTVILQGHLDMVCEKAPGCTIDFANDPLDVDVEGDWVFAHGTTLGGDDGVAVAMALAVLEADDLSHPPLEVLFTIDEETGMDGAVGLDTFDMIGRTLINVDSEEEGVLTVSCAGGAKAQITLPLAYEDNVQPAYEVTLSGLQGGHSGVEIDKGRLNANTTMGAFLKSIGCRIVSVSGGQKDNAIPVSSVAVITCDTDPTFLAEAFATLHRVETDPQLTLSVAPTTADRVMTAESTARVVEFLTTVPNGIQAMSADIEGLVQTSLNLGILTTDETALHATFAVRSSKNEEKSSLLSRLGFVALAFGGTCTTHGHYPAWEYRQESRLREVMCRVWQQQTGKSPTVLAIHAGLECGLFCEKLPGLDAVSIGPDMRDIHTCRERLSVSSTARVYEYLCGVLKEL